MLRHVYECIVAASNSLMRGLGIDQCLEETTLALKNDCPHRTTIFSWYRESQRGNFIPEDAEREGRERQ
ncbi:unnamed protein product [Acanthoscelides obtectus]|uniref:Uncharacterized protein n=1 Tax=Acanthoscelides obtectus TaxID=200917 RepID=A0A9P0LR17_ACAOB|nr:unnamed protein product [Acanthoscelides obtectus]CAK1651476.1 hypothetical protein AOBTE_LOCUS17312 [Acanthoscelides obtectus]